MVRVAPPTRGNVIGGEAPIIVTAELPPDLHRRFTDLRSVHYPPERNFLDAHVTLFHAVPSHCEAELRRFLARLASGTPPIAGRVEGVMALGGGGTAVRLSSPDLLTLRDEIADHFHGLLTLQDQHRPRLHVTIQNKVTAREASALKAQLEWMIQPQDFHFPGLAIHAYLGGPWEFLRRFAFRGK